MQDRNSSAGDCLEEVDINDVFNAIALSEESLVKSSYEEGYKIGQAQDNLEAFHLGYHRGAEIGAEIGFYSYFINNLTSDQTEKVSKILEPLNSLLESFPRGNDSSRDILKEIENIRSQFKRVCSILKMQLVKQHIENLLQFLEPNLKLANCHMVDFFTRSAYKNQLPKDIQVELDDTDHKTAINHIFKNDLTQLPKLKQFIEQSEKFTLKNCPEICISADSFATKLQKWGCGDIDKLKLEIFMSSKKSHEVEILSSISASVSKVCEISHLVDVGDGKGYLSSMIALQFKIPVLGIDASNINTCGAVKRATKLSKVWNGVQKTPKKSYPAIGDNTTSADINLYKQVTQYVNANVDFEKLVSDIYLCKPPLRLGITGLHTCGNLAPNSLRIFCKNECIKAICNIGCCYHLLSEKFEVSNNDNGDSEYGFPLSKFLCDKHVAIGRSARMIANHSVERILDKKELPNISIYHRALLQVLFENYCHELPAKHVGKFRKNCDNFIDYARKSMKRVNVDLDLTDRQIEELELKYQSRIDELNMFYLLRSKLSPVIESLILLDRLLFLYEQGYEHSYLVQFFNPVISPRCYGIVVLKDVNNLEV